MREVVVAAVDVAACCSELRQGESRRWMMHQQKWRERRAASPACVAVALTPSGRGVEDVSIASGIGGGTRGRWRASGWGDETRGGGRRASYGRDGGGDTDVTATGDTDAPAAGVKTAAGDTETEGTWTVPTVGAADETEMETAEAEGTDEALDETVASVDEG
ncbi:hypothetical protein F5148DRAFT_1151784 [Russula earlei]|uniref:Uncharacterized protein n=1 Tax=Russula earlei TaxID=71964 RepID=A0ACC0U0G6_9AGAM|nr:hypothetical protein F5148DRAFT_1151784 [Russula earlei]